MVKNLKRLRKQTERELGKKEAEAFDFFPTTFELPVSIVVLIFNCNEMHVIAKKGSYTIFKIVWL